ncbi:MAG: tRNA (adenosine(37)-N6)-dimethylallyltransferase MiaA [Candidatus Pacebacteria bacterium]|nr:tRNA (adenosine(37)-N6)-dimethylallyltransferase MiaA [Candidatus Paceibacterota bacterium]
MPKINPKIIVIVGPTASGKSDLAIKLARKFKGEIISADSRQVYRGMDVGTGKVTKKEQRLAHHHLIDVANPKKIFTVSDFKKLGEKAIKEIISKNKMPIIVGGTGQYIDTLVYNFSLPEVPPNYKLRAKLEKQSTEQLFEQLQKLDPERSGNIDSKNPRRLIRAIEIITATGQPVGRIKQESPYDVLWLGLNPKGLEKRISTRLSARIKQGMIAEVKKLRTGGISWQRLYDLGLEYRWVGQYLQNKITKDEMTIGLDQAIHQYSKRQMTWFKRNKNIHWVKNLTSATKLMKAFV